MKISMAILLLLCGCAARRTQTIALPDGTKQPVPLPVRRAEAAMAPVLPANVTLTWDQQGVGWIITIYSTTNLLEKLKPLATVEGPPLVVARKSQEFFLGYYTNYLWPQSGWFGGNN